MPKLIIEQKPWIDKILDLEASLGVKNNKVGEPVAQRTTGKSKGKDVPLLKKIRKDSVRHYSWGKNKRSKMLLKKAVKKKKVTKFPIVHKVVPCKFKNLPSKKKYTCKDCFGRFTYKTALTKGRCWMCIEKNQSELVKVKPKVVKPQMMIPPIEIGKKTISKPVFNMKGFAEQAKRAERRNYTKLDT